MKTKYNIEEAEYAGFLWFNGFTDTLLYPYYINGRYFSSIASACKELGCSAKELNLPNKPTKTVKLIKLD